MLTPGLVQPAETFFPERAELNWVLPYYLTIRCDWQLLVGSACTILALKRFKNNAPPFEAAYHVQLSEGGYKEEKQRFRYLTKLLFVSHPGSFILSIDAVLRQFLPLSCLMQS